MYISQIINTILQQNFIFWISIQRGHDKKNNTIYNTLMNTISTQ
jgi:hypothetical protein